MSYDGLLAETIAIKGHAGDLIPAYLARPLRTEPLPGVVVVDHNPGYYLLLRPPPEGGLTFPMCTSITSKLAISGSAKGAAGWMPVKAAIVYFDHPQHAPYDHPLSIDFLNEAASLGMLQACPPDPARSLRNCRGGGRDDDRDAGQSLPE